MMTTLAPTSATTKFPPTRNLSIGLKRIRFEVKQYFRSPDQVFFTFLFPTLLYALFSTVFSGFDMPDGVTMADYYLPCMIAGGILLSGTQNLAIEVASERFDGTLKRLGGSPLAPTSYFLGKFGQIFVTSLCQIVLLIAVAVFAFGAALPTTTQGWLTLLWIYLLGLVTCGYLGIALAAVPRSARTASAVVIPIVLVLQFISGVYLQFSLLPGWLQVVAGIFPVRWMAQGLRSAFLPESWGELEPGGSWQLGLCAIMLVLWLVIGYVLTRFTFRWTSGQK